ncbi:MAG: hypothetical protein ACM3ZQ_09665 [Bacillota bacterium]
MQLLSVGVKPKRGIPKGVTSPGVLMVIRGEVLPTPCLETLI